MLQGLPLNILQIYIVQSRQQPCKEDTTDQCHVTLQLSKRFWPSLQVCLLLCTQSILDQSNFKDCQCFLLVSHLPNCPVGLKLGPHSSFLSLSSHSRRQILYLPASRFRCKHHFRILRAPSCVSAAVSLTLLLQRVLGVFSLQIKLSINT